MAWLPSLIFSHGCYLGYLQIRDAKGWKVSGNFGNFPWKVSGILKGWEFSEILGMFNFDLFSIFVFRLFVQKSTELNSFFLNSNTLVLHYFLAVSWCVWVYNRKNHKTLLWVKITPKLLSLNYKIKYLICLTTLFLEFQQKLQIGKICF